MKRLEERIEFLSKEISNDMKEKKSYFKLLEEEIEAFKSGSKGMTSPNSYTSFSWPHQSSNSNSFNGSAHKEKLKLPKFDGEDHQEGMRWINKVENYFKYHRILYEEVKIYHFINALG